MENVFIQALNDSPKIVLDYDNAYIKFEGKSYCENSIEFYEPIILWLDTYFKNELRETTVDIKLTYFNAITSQILYEIFTKINNSNNINVTINWFHEINNEWEMDEIENFSLEFYNLKINSKTF